jgi:hypothetical protein
VQPAVHAGLGVQLEASDLLVGFIGLRIVEKSAARAIYATTSLTADAQSRPVELTSAMSNPANMTWRDYAETPD